MNLVKKNGSIVSQKSYAFALAIISLYKNLSTEKREFILSKQVLRSGTSIGANINEALAGESKKDFIHKMSISLKEARETAYWLNLLSDSAYIEKDEYTALINNCNELMKILSSIILTTKEKYLKKQL